MTALQRLIERFDIVVRRPEDVTGLRQLILQLAVRGRLVAQEAGDEPAEVLLGRIQQAKQTLIDSGKLRGRHEPQPLNAAEQRFELPNSWAWVRLGELGEIVGGGTPKTNIAEYWADEGIPWLTPADLYGLTEKSIGEGRRFISQTGLENSSARLLPAGSVLFSSRAPIGYVAIAENELATNQGFKSCVPYIMEMNHYLYHFLKSEGKRIDENASGTTFKEVSGKDMFQIPVPLPPLTEQHRIVAQVEALLGQADELAERLAAAERGRGRLRAAALGRAAAPGGDGAAAALLLRHFDRLFDTPAAVAELKAAVLQLAVMGRLVPQEDGDEPAEVLLGRIGDSQSTRQSTPHKWVPVKVADVTLQVTDGEHTTPPRVSSSVDFSIPLATAKNVRDGYLDLNNTDYVSLETAKKSWQRCKPEHNDVLMVCVGATTGRACLLKNPPDMVLVRSVALLRPDQEILSPEYFSLVLKSPSLQGQIWQKVRRTAQPCLYLGRMNTLEFFLPPLAEQHRIVARVDALFALADEAAARSAAAEEGRGRIRNYELGIRN